MRMKTLSIYTKIKFPTLKTFVGILFLIALITPFKQVSAQTLWYYNGTGALNNTSSWGTNSNGTGGTLSDFTSGGRYFIIQNTTAVSLSGVWNIGNTNFANAGGDSLIIGNPTTPAAPITLTMLPGSLLSVNKSKTISVSMPSSGNQKIIYQNSTPLSFGTLYDPNVELVFDGNTITTSSSNSFGDVSVINNADVNMGSANAKFRNFYIEAGSTVSGPIGGTSNYIGIRTGGTVTINGTFRAGRTGGLATTTGVVAFPSTIITNGTNTTSTNSSAATAASTSGLNQTVTCASTTNLTVGAIITVASGTGAFPAGTYVKAITSSTKFTASVAPTTALSGATISATLRTLPCISSSGVTVGGTVSLVGGTGAFASNTTITGVPNSTSVAISAAPTSTIGSGSTVQITFAPQSSWSTLVFEDTVRNVILGSSSTIDFNRGTSGQTAAQSIDTMSYANIILSNSGTSSGKTFVAGTINISGSFTVNNLLGSITQPSSTTINFTGTSAQTIPSQLTTFSVLGISGGGTKTLSGNASVTSSLNLVDGVLATSTNTLTVTSSGTVARTNGWVNGNLNRNIGTGTAVARTFHIGDATNYTPLTLTFASVTTAGNLTASTGTPISGVANYVSAPISSTAYVNRYWNVTNPSSLSFTNYDAKINYVAGDLVGGATSSSLITAQNVSGTWSKPTTTGSTNFSTASGLTTIGHFVLANNCITVTPSVSISSTSTSFCTGSSSTFTATATNGGSSPTYQWKNNGNNIGTNSATLVLNAANVANGDVITCVMTANNVCQTTATATSNSLTLAVGSTVTPSVSISGASTICSGSANTYTAQATNGGSSPSFQWLKNGNNVGSASSIQFDGGTLNTNDVISCVLTANNTCQTTATANSNTITLTVIPSPVLGTSSNVSTFCTLGSVKTIYNTNTSNGGVWVSSNPSVASVSTAGNGASGAITANANGTANITYTKTGANGCVSTSNAVAVTVAAVATPEAISGTNTICIGNTTNLSTSTTGGVWSSSNNKGTISNGGVYTGTNGGAGEARYTVTNGSGCSAYASYAITVNNYPNLPTISYAPGTVNPQTGAPAGSFCTNKTFTVVGTPTGGVWSKTGVISVTSPAGVVSTGSTPGAGSLTYTITVNGCSSSRTISGNVVSCAARGVVDNSSLTMGNSQWTMYPNPAKSVININVETLVGSGKLLIIDYLGKLVKEQPLSMGTNTVNIANLNKGMYFVSTITNEGKTTKKLVVE